MGLRVGGPSKNYLDRVTSDLAGAGGSRKPKRKPKSQFSEIIRDDEAESFSSMVSQYSNSSRCGSKRSARRHLPTDPDETVVSKPQRRYSNSSEGNGGNGGDGSNTYAKIAAQQSSRAGGGNGKSYSRGGGGNGKSYSRGSGGGGRSSKGNGGKVDYGANSYAKIAAMLDGKSTGTSKKRSGSCSWHSGINKSISTDKRKSIEKRLSWMETAFDPKKEEKPEDCGKSQVQAADSSESQPHHEVLGRMDDRISRLMIYDLPGHVRDELDGLSQDMDSLKTSL